MNDDRDLEYRTLVFYETLKTQIDLVIVTHSEIKEHLSKLLIHRDFKVVESILFQSRRLLSEIEVKAREHFIKDEDDE